MRAAGPSAARLLAATPLLLAAALPAADAPPARHRAPPIVVTATRTGKSLFDVPASVHILRRADSLRIGATTVDRLFESVAGADLQGSGVPGSAAKLTLRGLTPGYQSKRVLVLVDGRRVNDAYQGNVELGLLPTDNIERIEVIRGPVSALYGSNAMGGVINIVTRRGATSPGTELGAGYGSYDTRRFTLAHGSRSGPLDWFVTCSRVQTDGYLDNADGSDRDWSAVQVSGDLGYALTADSSLRAQAGYYGGEGTDESSDREIRRNFQSATYDRVWNARREAALTVRVYRNGQWDRYDWKYPGEGIYRQQTLAAEIQQSLWVADRHRATAGTELRRDEVDISEVTGPVNEHESVAAVYAQDEIFLTENLHLQLGLRNDTNPDYGTEWSPRAGLLWRATPATESYVSWGRAHRAPALSDRFVKTEYGGFLFQGNPDLRPETLTAYEAGLRHRQQDGWSVELALFQNDLEDSFDFMLDPDGVFRNRNVTGLRTRGAEVTLRARLTARLDAFATYSFTDGAYDDFPADPVVKGNRPAYLARHKAAAGLVLSAGRLDHFLAVRYVDERFGDAQNTEANRMDDYLTADYHARCRLTDAAHASFHVRNLFDHTYQDFPGLNQPGRHVTTGLEWSL